MSHDLDSILNFVQLTDDWATSGQPSEEQLGLVARSGFTHAIRLSTLESGLPNEAEAAAGLGLDYLHIPVVWLDPKPSDLAAFFAAMDARRGKKLYIHCALNRRVSVFMAIYRTRHCGYQREQAMEDVLGIWQPDKLWAGFLRDGLDGRILDDFGADSSSD